MTTHAPNHASDASGSAPVAAPASPIVHVTDPALRHKLEVLALRWPTIAAAADHGLVEHYLKAAPIRRSIKRQKKSHLRALVITAFCWVVAVIIVHHLFRLSIWQLVPLSIIPVTSSLGGVRDGEQYIPTPLKLFQRKESSRLIDLWLAGMNYRRFLGIELGLVISKSFSDLSLGTSVALFVLSPAILIIAIPIIITSPAPLPWLILFLGCMYFGVVALMFVTTNEYAVISTMQKVRTLMVRSILRHMSLAVLVVCAGGLLCALLIAFQLRPDALHFKVAAYATGIGATLAAWQLQRYRRQLAGRLESMFQQHVSELEPLFQERIQQMASEPDSAPHRIL